MVFTTLVETIIIDGVFRLSYNINEYDKSCYTCNHYYRKSQTLTHNDHVAEETLSHLVENGIRLVSLMV